MNRLESLGVLLAVVDAGSLSAAASRTPAGEQCLTTRFVEAQARIHTIRVSCGSTLTPMPLKNSKGTVGHAENHLTHRS